MSYRIMVIEGGRFNKRLLYALQEDMEDLEFCTVKNGSEAITLLKDSSCDMVLCDLTMPCMDGAQFLLQLAAFKQRPALAFFSSASRRTLVYAFLTAKSLGFTAVGLITKVKDVKDLRNLQVRWDRLDGGEGSLVYEAVEHDIFTQLLARNRMSIFEPT